MANEPLRYNAGIVTAYGAAVRGGYTGTYEEFCQQQADYAETAAAVAQAKVDAEAAARRAEAAVESYDEMTAAATGLPHGSDPTSEIDRTGEHPVLRLGIPDGAQGNPGEDGYSPTVSITTISGGHRVTITDRTGDHTADIMDGDKGDPGNDGYSPTVTITDITGGHRITITDKTGNHTADVMDGDKGDPGNDGFSPTVTVTNITDGHRVTITDAQGAHTFDVMNGSAVVDVSDTQPTDPFNKMWIRATESSSVQVPTYQEFTTEQERVNRALNALEPTATSADVGKTLVVKSVSDGKVSEYVLQQTEKVSYEEETGVSVAFNAVTGGRSLKELLVDLPFTQSGAGDPSPSNVRTITGTSSCTITHNATTYLYAFSDSAGTVYGGVLNAMTGLLTVTWACVDLGEMSYDCYSSIGNLFEITDARVSSAKALNYNYACEIYKATDKARSNLGNNEIGVYHNGEQYRNRVMIKDTRYSSVEAFKTGVSGVKFVFELLMPQTYQLTGNDIQTLTGQNTISTNIGTVTVQYPVATEDVIYHMIALLEEQIEEKADRTYKTQTSDSVTFTAEKAGIGVKQITVNLQPIQSGTGDPSPTNIRQIGGFTGCTITHSDGDEASVLYPFSWQNEAGTVYGGTLNALTGILTVMWTCVDVSTLSWGSIHSTYANTFITSSISDKALNYNFICEIYKTVQKSRGSLENNEIGVYYASESYLNRLAVKDTRYTTTEDFLAGIAGYKIAYELKNAVSYQLDPIEVLTLLGTNVISSNNGTVTVTYPTESNPLGDVVTTEGEEWEA